MIRALLLRVLYGRAWRSMRALDVRCEAAGVDVRDALSEAGRIVRRLEGELSTSLAMTRRHEAVSKLRHRWHRLPVETAITLVRIATEGIRAE